MALRLALVLALVLAAWRTGGAQGQPARDPEPPAAAGEPPVIVALGDSLTAGFGLPEEQSYPALLQERLRQRGYPHRVVNAGVSGDTSAGALARMGWLLRQRVDLLIVCLGANDGLRGLATDQLRENLARIIEQGQAAGARVILAGMRMPLNYGPAYTRAFAAVYPALARRYGVALIPFLLEGVAAQPALNLPDGIHPNAQGQRIVLENVWRVLEPLLSEKAAVRR
ncbi:MAG: arylesterase [Candidatus Lambdaproteobacteria bacterium]|nr:arylesterase [Candidatus Lambdaproteobacteria bacterium]